MRSSSLIVAALLLAVAACSPGGTPPQPAQSQAGSELVPAERDAKAALGREYQSAAELYAGLKAKANGGQPLSLDDMPDWTGFWQRVGPPFFDPSQTRDELTTAKLKPEALAELAHRRELSAQGVE